MARNKLQKFSSCFMDELGLVDAYRVVHPKKKAFTYESKSLKLKSRIDFFSLPSP